VMHSWVSDPPDLGAPSRQRFKCKGVKK
jgi:hypothetical protein